MGDIVKYTAINTKIKALERNLLTEEQYNMLMECRNYAEAVRYLKEETFYYNALDEYNIEQIHRGQLEHILKKWYIRNFYKLSHYFNGDYKKLFKILFMKFEVEDLKVIIRGKYIGKEKEYIESLMTYESPLNNINYDKLILSKDLYGVVEELKNTKYYKHIYPLVGTIRQEGLFRIETTLDFVYFSSLRKFIKKLRKEDSEIIHKITGIYSDLLNIQWVIRGKKYYNLTPEVLLNYTIYDGYKLNINKIKELCYAANSEELFKLITRTPYGNVFGKGDKEEFLIEKDMLAYMRNIYRQYKKDHKNNISVVMAYLELALLEIRDIVSLIESKRYSLNNQDAFKYMSITSV